MPPQLGRREALVQHGSDWDVLSLAVVFSERVAMLRRSLRPGSLRPHCGITCGVFGRAGRFWFWSPRSWGAFPIDVHHGDPRFCFWSLATKFRRRDLSAKSADFVAHHGLRGLLAWWYAYFCGHGDWRRRPSFPVGMCFRPGAALPMGFPGGLPEFSWRGGGRWVLVVVVAGGLAAPGARPPGLVFLTCWPGPALLVILTRPT